MILNTGIENEINNIQAAKNIGEFGLETCRNRNLISEHFAYCINLIMKLLITKKIRI